MRLRADGGHLRAGPRGAGEAGLCGQRADFAGAVRRLPQREDAERERAAHQPGEPRGPRRHGVRPEPQAASFFFEAQTCKKDALYVGVDVVRCRRNGLANAPFPLPILCPADGVAPVDGVLPDLWRAAATRGSPASICCRTWGPAGTPKVSLAAMLDLGVCRWDHIVLGISARSHVDAATLRRALERMDAAWPEGEEHMANSAWARSTEVVYSARSSSSELDGAGADFSQAFAYEGGMVWDFVYARRLLSNGTYRPIHDAALGFEHCMVAKARRILDAPPRYLAQVKTDCLLTQRLPKRFAERLRALEELRHPDGTPVYRVEETRPLLGSRAPCMEAGAPNNGRGGRPYKPLPGGHLPAAHGPAGHRKDAPGPDHCGKAARAGRGGAPGPGGAGCAGTCAGAARKSWTGWLWKRSRSWTWRSGRTWPAWG